MDKYFKAFKANPDDLPSSKELKRRYRILLNKYHPDKPNGDTEKTKFITVAYTYVSKKVKENEDKEKERQQRKLNSLNKKFYFYSDGTIYDRVAQRIVKYKGRKINVNA